MATIKAIEQRSVHQIQSGQVIIDITSVVKELVENSLDAGASSIDVRFKNYGVDSIEIQDNGNGIGPDDFESVALKHYTSKIRNFEDIDSLETFGFRGEALSSLSALSTLRIVTARGEDGAVGKRLEFEISGKLKSATVTAAQQGTTVFVENIFHNLPVRKKALEKNAAREYQKALRFLEACACIATDLKFTVSHQPSKSTRKTVFSTKGNQTIKENITNVFGAKTMSALLKLSLELTPQSHHIHSSSEAQDLGIAQEQQSQIVRVNGFVSIPNWGEGRGATDRQMLFVNSRPCLLPQVIKAFNEVYKPYNSKQHPFIIANFEMDTSAYDVNVSPDKRTIMLHDQTAILEQLKEALSKLFENVAHQVPTSQLQPQKPQKLPNFKPVTIQRDVESARPASAMDEDQLTAPTERIETHRASDLRESSTNLIEDWAGRASTMRKPSEDKETSLPTTRASSPAQSEEDNTSLFVAQDTGARSNVFGDRSEEMRNGPITLPRATQPTSSYAFGTPLQDMLTQPTARNTQARQISSTQGRAHQQSTLHNRSMPSRLSQQSSRAPHEEEIPSSTFNSKPRVERGPIENAFARMRPQRDSPDIADITIGENSIRMIVEESDPKKKRRIHTFHDSAIDLDSSPLTARSMLDFAAPGSELATQRDLAKTQQTQQRNSRCSDDSEFADVAVGEEFPELTPNDMEDRASLFQREDTMLIDGGNKADNETSFHEETDCQDDDHHREQEEATIAQLIDDAEKTTLPRSSDATRRTLARPSSSKDLQVKFDCTMQITTEDVLQSARIASQTVVSSTVNAPRPSTEDSSLDAESKLSLTVSKSDFEHMHIIGQFNLGFILAIRPSKDDSTQDELFIIDQHAADEKYNFEKFRSALVLQSQRLVQPKTLELSAVDQEVILNHSEALKANGFNIEMVESGDDEASIRAFQLTSLPMSANRTFTLADLEELLHLLSELPTGSSEIPRPRKVQQMLAMRACRSSIMVGKTLTEKQMENVVRHMGEMEKPWNCPHGRPTMRHLSSLGSWKGWYEWQNNSDSEAELPHTSDGGAKTDWKSWMSAHA